MRHRQLIPCLGLIGRVEGHDGFALHDDPGPVARGNRCTGGFLVERRVVGMNEDRPVERRQRLTPIPGRRRELAESPAGLILALVQTARLRYSIALADWPFWS